MPSNISKGEILKRFDDYCNNPNVDGAGTRGAQQVLDFYKTNNHIDDWLEQAETAWDVAGTPILEPANKDREHVELHWFGITQRPSHAGGEVRKQRKGWWPELHRMDRVLKPGLMMALRLCLYPEADESKPKLATPRKLSSYWMCAGHHYEVSSLVTDEQVTLLIATPSPRFSRRHGTFTGAEDIWITRSGGKDRGEIRVEDHGQDVKTIRPKFHRIGDN